MCYLNSEFIIVKKFYKILELHFSSQIQTVPINCQQLLSILKTVSIEIQEFLFLNNVDYVYI